MGIGERGQRRGRTPSEFKITKAQKAFARPLASAINRLLASRLPGNKLTDKNTGTVAHSASVCLGGRCILFWMLSRC